MPTLQGSTERKEETVFKNSKIGTRLMAGFSVVIALTIGISAFAWWENSRSAAHARDMFTHPFAATAGVQRAAVDILKANRAFQEALLTEDPIRFKGCIGESDMDLFELERDMTGARAIYQGSQKDMDDITRVVGEWKVRRDAYVRMVQEGRKQQALQDLPADTVMGMAQIDAEINDVISHSARSAQQFMEGAEKGARETAIVLFIVLVVIAAFSFMIAIMTSRSVVHPLQAAVEAADRMAEGDLGTDIDVHRRDETGLLAEALRNMMRRTGDIIKRLSESVQTLTSSSEQLSAASTQLVGGSSEIVAAVEETSASIEEIKGIAHGTDEKARAVADKAQAAVAVSQDGRLAVDGTVARMEDIRDQMTALGDIILRLSGHGQTINEIIIAVEDLADQSNMLAVNAAIEAAKAGEEGRGFAVVAQEIRVLADQSRQATTKVRAIVQDIQKSTNAAVLATEKGAKVVEDGVLQSMHAGESIVKLMGSIDDTAQAGTVIAASAREQIVGMDQIMIAVRQVKAATTQNVTAAQELQKTAKYLAAMGKGLSDIVLRFRT